MCGKLIDDKILVVLSRVDEPTVEEVQHHGQLTDQPNGRYFPDKQTPKDLVNERVNIECVARLVLLAVCAGDHYAVRDRLGSYDADVAPARSRVAAFGQRTTICCAGTDWSSMKKACSGL